MELKMYDNAKADFQKSIKILDPNLSGVEGILNEQKIKEKKPEKEHIILLKESIEMQMNMRKKELIKKWL